MAFTWPSKKEVREPSAKPEYPEALEALEPVMAEPPAAKTASPLRTASREAPRQAVAPSDPLPALTERLESLGQLLDEAKEQVTSYLLHRESQSSSDDVSKLLARKFDALAERLDKAAGGGSPAAPSAGDGGGSGVSEAALKPVAEKLDQFDARLKSIDALKEPIVAALTKLRDAHIEQHNALGTSLRQIGEMVPQYFNALPQYFNAVQQQVVAAQQHADAGLRTIIDILRPPQKETGPTVGGDWQEALLGGELAHNPALNADKNRLLSGVLSGDPAACGLVGSLLLFRSAAADKMPPLLKDLGEAFYRWHTKTSNRPSELEKALAEWAMRACDQAGMANTIELVNPGERFDSLRHNASRPGVEITQVLGWIVLRDNGKVYTKASVAVK
jgi:hypothetical protein